MCKPSRVEALDSSTRQLSFRAYIRFPKLLRHLQSSPHPGCFQSSSKIPRSLSLSLSGVLCLLSQMAFIQCFQVFKVLHIHYYIQKRHYKQIRYLHIKSKLQTHLVPPPAFPRLPRESYSPSTQRCEQRRRQSLLLCLLLQVLD